MKIKRREFIRGIGALGVTAMIPGVLHSVEDETALEVVSDDDWSLKSDLRLPKFSLYDTQREEFREWECGPAVMTLVSSYVSYDSAEKKDACIFQHIWNGAVPWENYNAAHNLVLFEMAKNPVDWAKDLGLCHGLEPGILQCFCDCKTRAIEPGSEHYKTRFPIMPGKISVMENVLRPDDEEDNVAPWYDIPGICRISLVAVNVVARGV